MDTWDPQANEVFLKALGIASAEERAAYLDRACADNAQLRGQVDAFLLAHEHAGHFLESPATASMIHKPRPAAEGPGTVIGPYKLLEQIGEGGFGIVFMAEQDHPIRRKVALKIVKPGMDTRQVIARFEAERQALALMDHPNIAKVFDAGETASGRPYFVMELVKGIPITTYCDQGKLPLPQRLELFIHVCQAVQHAHHKGIVHRDIKPSNILVTLHDGEPVVKVIDFGIAKAMGQELTDKTVFTGFAQILGTPLYASPEQITEGGLDIDTRTDVYSLGVLLYELLTGSTPFEKERLQKAAYDEMQRIIRDEDPPRPSTRMTTMGETSTTIAAQRASQPRRLAQSFRGELDCIVMKALEKNRARRYDTPQAFAGDLLRYLANEPVEARPPTAAYKMSKFVKRHTWGTAVAAAAIVLLASSTILIWNEQRKTEAALVTTETALVEKERNRMAAEIATAESEARREELRRSFYVSQMNLAGTAAETVGGLGRAHELLLPWQQSQPDLRGWEWYYLDGLCHRERLTLPHPTVMHSVAWSPNGTRLATAGADGYLRLWYPTDGNQIWARNCGDELWATAWSPDGLRLATGSQKGSIQIWDALTGEPVRTLSGPGPASKGNGVARSPVGKRTAAVAWSPDGSRLASASFDRTVRVWDLLAGKELFSIPQSGPVSSVAWNPTGTRLALSLGHDGSSAPHPGIVSICDAGSGAVIQSFVGHEFALNTLAWSPDGSRLATAGVDRMIKIWDAANGSIKQQLAVQEGMVESLSWSPDGTRLVSGGQDTTFKIWDAGSDAPPVTLRGHFGNVQCVAWSSDGTRVASASNDNTVKIWDVAAETQDRRLKGHTLSIQSLAWSPDSQRVASGSIDGTVRIWPPNGGHEEFCVVAPDAKIWSVSWSPHGTLVASAGSDDKIRLTQTETGKVTEFACQGPLSVAWSPDGKRLAVGYVDGLVRIQDPATGGELLRLAGHTLQVNSVAWSPDGTRLVSGSADQTIRMWDSTSGTQLMRIPDRGGGVCALTWSPDGARLASSKTNTGSIRIWDASNGQLLRTIPGPWGAVWSLAWNPNSTRLATGNQDGIIRIWDPVAGEQLLALRGHTRDVIALAWSPDGRRLASAGLNDEILIQDASFGYAAQHAEMPAPASLPGGASQVIGHKQPNETAGVATLQPATQEATRPATVPHP